MADEPTPGGFESINIEYIGEVPTADVVDVIDHLEQDSFDIYVHRRGFNIAAGGIGLLEAAIIITISPYVTGFMNEAGKEHFLALKNACKTLWGRVRGGIETPHGFYHPFELVVQLRSGKRVGFLFEAGLPDDAFESALLEIDALVTVEGASSDAHLVQYKYSADEGQWVRDFAWSDPASSAPSSRSG